MKRQSYIESKKVKLVDLKTIVNQIINDYELLEFKYIINLATSIEELVLNIQDQPKFHQTVFKWIKYKADLSRDYIELEQWIIYLLILIDRRYPPLVSYIKNLINFIMDTRDLYFTSDEYCVLRHLTCYDYKNLDDIIKWGWQNLNQTTLLYKIFTCEIYLIEKQYKHAKSILDEIGWISLLNDYYEDYYKHFRFKILINRVNLHKQRLILN